MVQNLIMADVHSNLTALEAVLNHANLKDNSKIYCLGDIVGYGPEPNRCIQKLRDLNVEAVAGNHDAASCGKMATDYFNWLATRAAEWTGEQLSTTNLNYLRNLPDSTDDDWFEYYHGSPREPLTEYITSRFVAQDVLNTIDGNKIAIGHTHQPVYYRQENTKFQGYRVNGTKSLHGITSDEPLVINPGSVGQPRDGDPRASYVVTRFEQNGRLDLEWHRVEYDISTVQSKIRSEGLPEKLASRLARGK